MLTENRNACRSNLAVRRHEHGHDRSLRGPRRPLLANGSPARLSELDRRTPSKRPTFRQGPSPPPCAAGVATVVRTSGHGPTVHHDGRVGTDGGIATLSGSLEGGSLNLPNRWTRACPSRAPAQAVREPEQREQPSTDLQAAAAARRSRAWVSSPLLQARNQRTQGCELESGRWTTCASSPGPDTLLSTALSRASGWVSRTKNSLSARGTTEGPVTGGLRPRRL